MNVVTERTDAKLIEMVSRIIEGDPAAEEELVVRYKRGVAIIAARIVRNYSAAEDVAQETFRIALEKIRRGDVRQADRLSGFICGVARNAAIDYVRRLRSFASSEDISNAEQIPDAAPDQLEEIINQERAAIVRRVINELKIERDRDLLFRYFVREQSKDEICADLILTSAQFNNVISRAIARFKELYLRHIRRAGQ